MTRYNTMLKELLKDNNITNCTVGARIETQNKKLYDFDLLWYDDINDVIKYVPMNEDDKICCNELEVKACILQPIRYKNIMNEVEDALYEKQ